MRAEVLAIGTELLLGQVVDTNGAWLGEQLAAAGIDCLYQAKVGDNLPRIVRAIRDALARADAVICCGGLGPTQDDITREALAEVLGVGLVPDDAVAARIRARFADRGRPMAENNLRQALVPLGATVIPQVTGTAPGLICPVGEKVVYALPGVPGELREMVPRAVLPDLVARAGERTVIASRTLRTWGVAESALAERLAGRIEALDAAGNPTIAFLASGIEGIRVRITAKVTGPDAPTRADAQLAAEEAEVRAVLGEVVFGVDEQTMEAVVGARLVELGLTMAVAESLTGGLISTRLTEVPGASSWFRGGIVSYAAEAKRDLLGVGEGPVVTERAATEMALGVTAALGAEVGLAVTGVAGPDPAEGQPVGTVWVGLAIPQGPEAVLLRLGGSDRHHIRQLTVISALDLLRRRLAGS